MDDEQKHRSISSGSSINTAGGPLYTAIATERKVLTYAVTKPELEAIGTLNSVAALFFSIGTGLLGFAGDSLLDWIAASPTPMTRAVVVTCGVLSAVCYLIAVYVQRKRGSVLKDITSP